MAVYNHYLGRRVPWQFLAGNGEMLDWPAPQTVTFDSGDPLVEGSLGGLGVAQVMEFAVREHLQAGRLVRCCPSTKAAPALSLVYPRTRQASPRIKALAQLLLAQTQW
ncbi:rRNA-processing protein UTP23 [Manis javanica]|nr:rRNA-processing protein UTP23 [Manis javanica]